jgi:histidine triad (HIT) family protein
VKAPSLTKPDCLFCKMARGEIPVVKLYEDEHCFVIKDIRPKAPTHLLVITHQHIDSLFHTEKMDEPLLGYLLNTLKKIAKTQGLTSFRTVINSGALSGQEIFHLHIHLLSGPNRSLAWD